MSINKNCLAIFLHVIEYNKTAISFYKKLNFLSAGISKNYYQNINNSQFNAYVFYKEINKSNLFTDSIFNYKKEEDYIFNINQDIIDKKRFNLFDYLLFKFKSLFYFFIFLILVLLFILFFILINMSEIITNFCKHLQFDKFNEDFDVCYKCGVLLNNFKVLFVFNILAIHD